MILQEHQKQSEAFSRPSAGLEETFSHQHEEEEARKNTVDSKVRAAEQRLTHNGN